VSEALQALHQGTAHPVGVDVVKVVGSQFAIFPGLPRCSGRAPSAPLPRRRAVSPALLFEASRQPDSSGCESHPARDVRLQVLRGRVCHSVPMRGPGRRMRRTGCPDRNACACGGLPPWAAIPAIQEFVSLQPDGKIRKPRTDHPALRSAAIVASSQTIKLTGYEA